MRGALLVTMLSAVPSLAEVPPPRSLAIIEVKSGSAERERVTALTSVFAAEASKFDVRVVAPSDIVNLLGLERQKQLLGCSDGGCIAEIGAALGVEYMLVPEVSRIGESWLMTVTLLDVRGAAALERSTTRAPTLDGLVEQLGPVVGNLLAPHFPARQPSRAGGVSKLGIGLCAGAGALIALGAVFGVLGLTSYQEAVGLQTSPDQAAFTAARGSSQRYVVLADVLYAVGAVVLGAGLFVVIRF